MADSINLDSQCGRHLTFRDLLECGETWAGSARSGTPIDNWPIQPESLEALERLCHLLVDPVIDDF